MIKLCSIFSLLLISFSVFASEENNELVDMSEPKRCLNLHAIKNMKIVDANNILFYARGNKLYRNTLPRKCSGLKPGSVISYNVHIGRLCRRDLISVMDKFGDRFSPASKCGLGSFEQIPILEELTEED